MLLLIICAIYTLVGCSAFVVFLLLGNYSSAVLAVITGIINAMTMHLCWLKLRNRISEWYDEQALIRMARIGFAYFALGIASIVYHSVIEIMLHKPILPINQSEIISIIWSIIVAKCGLILKVTSNFSNEAYEDDMNPIVNDIQNNGETDSMP